MTNFQLFQKQQQSRKELQGKANVEDEQMHQQNYLYHLVFQIHDGSGAHL